MSGKIYPIGIQNFEKIRKGGYFYIDKTALIYQLVKTGSYYFLSRPRRFGKSLLISTLEAYFQGKRELFEGLAMEKLEKEWITYPVLHLDLNTEKYDTPESLENKLNGALVEWEKMYGAEPSEKSLAMRFEGIIKRACQQEGQSVVILVDEYDKPMLQAIGDDVLQKSFRSTLKAFYGALKSQDGCIKFALLTGVTKFGKVSVFSDLNNLNDISMWNKYIGICGVSEQELYDNLDAELHEFANVQGVTYEEICGRLKEMYDGYHFTHNSKGMYNPFSLLLAFDRNEFKSYWFETGTPTYLVELLKKHHYDLHRMAHEETDEQVLNSIDSESTNPIPVIYQSGYLTIKGWKRNTDRFLLDFPNNEVKNSFLSELARSYFKSSKGSSVGTWIIRLQDALEEGGAEELGKLLRSFLAGIPYTLHEKEPERHFQYTLYLIFKLLNGEIVEAEKEQSQGRVDCIVETRNYIYIFEFKLDGSAEEALEQIEERGYAKEYGADQRKLYRIGANFSSKTGTIEEWKVV